VSAPRQSARRNAATISLSYSAAIVVDGFWSCPATEFSNHQKSARHGQIGQLRREEKSDLRFFPVGFANEAGMLVEVREQA